MSFTTLADLAGLLRRARVDDAPVVVAGPGALRVRRRGAVTLDAHNAVAEVDGTVTLAHAARALLRAGAIFPIARPLPPLTLMQACAALPFFVDAFVQQASLVTGEGDAAETPRAPRAAAGPSLLGALCSRPPLAVAARARVRVMLSRHARVRREVHGSTRAVAERIRVLLDDGRPFAIDAFGTTLLILDATVTSSLSSPSSPSSTSSTSSMSSTSSTSSTTSPSSTSSPSSPSSPSSRSSRSSPSSPSSRSSPSSPLTRSLASTDRFAHAGAGRRARFDDATSIAPGDLDAIAAALDAGGRVVGAPFMGRCAALVRAPAAQRVLVDSMHGAAQLTSSWSRSENA